jgi:hypothetical protein
LADVLDAAPDHPLSNIAPSLTPSPPPPQVADKVASKGALVVLADVLGAAPDHPLSNIEQKGEAHATKSDAISYWPMHRWVVRVM